MSYPDFSEFPPIPLRSAPEADFDAKMVVLFTHFAVTHRAEMIALIEFLKTNSTIVGGELNATNIGLVTPAEGRFYTAEILANFPRLDFTDLDADDAYSVTRLVHSQNRFDIRSYPHDKSVTTIDYAITKDAAGAREHSWRIAGVEKLLLDALGRLGLGTDAPSARAHVLEDANDQALLVDVSSGSYSSQALRVSAARPASSDYSLMRAFSGDGSDTEFNLRGDGQVYADGAFNGGGADYAEFWEWQDGNPASEDRRGFSVVLVGDKIRPALDGEDPIGVISANPSVCGDADIDRWKGKYLRDEFNAYLWEDYELVSWVEVVTETTEIDGELVENLRPVLHSYAADQLPEGVVPPEGAGRITQRRRMLNPAFDPSLPYTPREERQEWDAVGLMGKLRLRKGQPVGARWIKMRDISETVEEWLVR